MKTFQFEFPDKPKHVNRSISPAPTHKKSSSAYKRNSTPPPEKSQEYSFKDHSDSSIAVSQGMSGSNGFANGDVSLLSTELQRLHNINNDLKSERQNLSSNLRLLQTEEDIENRLLDIIADKKRLEELITIYSSKAQKSSDKSFAEFLRQINLWQRNFFSSQLKFTDVDRAIDFVTAERRRLQEKFEAKEKDFESLSEKLRDAIDKQSKIVEDNSRLKMLVLKDVEDKISSKNKDKLFDDIADQKLPELKLQMKKLLEENKSLKLHNKQLSSSYHKIKDHSSLIHSDEIKKYTDRIEELESKYSMTIAENECLRDQLNSRFKDSEAVECRIKQSLNKLTTKSFEKENRQISPHISIQEIEDLESVFEKRFKLANEEIELLQKKVNLLERANSKSLSDEKQLRNEKSKLQKDLDEFARKIELFNGQEITMAHLRTTLEEKQAMEKYLNEKISQLTRDLDGAKSHLNKSHENNMLIPELTKTIDVLKTECESLIKENEELVSVVAAANEEKASVSELNKHLDVGLAEAEVPYENIQADNIQEMAKSKIDLLIQCFLDVRSSLLSKSVENSTLNHRTAASAKEIEIAKREIMRYLQIDQEGLDLEKLIKRLISECEKLDSGIQELNSTLDVLRDSNAHFKVRVDSDLKLFAVIYRLVAENSALQPVSEKSETSEIASQIIEGINILLKNLKSLQSELESLKNTQVDNYSLKARLEEQANTIRTLTGENERRERLAASFSEDVARINSKIESLRNHDILRVSEDLKASYDSYRSREGTEFELLERQIRKKLASVYEESEKLKKELESTFNLNQDLAKINQDLVLKLQEVRNYSTDLEVLKNAVELASATKTEQNEALHKRVAELEGLRSENLSEITRLKDQKLILESNISNLEAERSRVITELKSLSQANTDLKTSLEQANQDSEAKLKHYQELENENFQLLELKAQLDTLINEVQALRQNTAQIEKEKEDALNQVLAAKKDFEVMVHEKNQKINELNIKNTEAINDYKALWAQFEAKSSELITSKNECEAQLESRITELEEENNQLTSNNNLLSTELVNFEKVVEKLTLELQEATQQVNQLKSIEEQHILLKENFDKIEAELTETKTEANELIVTLDKTKAEAACTEKALKSKIEDLVRQIDEHRSKLIEAANHLDHMNELRNKVTVLSTENSLLKRQNQNREKEYSSHVTGSGRKSYNEVVYESERRTSVAPEDSYLTGDRFNFENLYKDKYEKLVKENEELKSKLVVHNNRYNSTVVTSPFEVDDLRTSLALKNKEIDQLKTNTNELKNNFESLMRSNAELLQQIQNNREIIDKLSFSEKILIDRVNSLTNENNELKLKLGVNDPSKHTRSKSTTPQRPSEQSELDRLRNINKQYQDLQGKYLMVKVDSERKTGELETMRRQIDDLKFKLENQASENAVLSPSKKHNGAIYHNGSHKKENLDLEDIQKLKEKNAELLKENKRLRVLASDVMNEMSILKKSADKEKVPGDSGAKAKLRNLIMNSENNY